MTLFVQRCALNKTIYLNKVKFGYKIIRNRKMDVDPILFSSLNEYILLFKDQQDLFTLNLSLFALNQVEFVF